MVQNISCTLVQYSCPTNEDTTIDSNSTNTSPNQYFPSSIETKVFTPQSRFIPSNTWSLAIDSYAYNLYVSVYTYKTYEEFLNNKKLIYMIYNNDKYGQYNGPQIINSFTNTKQIILFSTGITLRNVLNSIWEQPPDTLKYIPKNTPEYDEAYRTALKRQLKLFSIHQNLYFTITRIRQITKQLLFFLWYLRCLNIVHGSLYPENIFLQNSNSGRIQVSLPGPKISSSCYDPPEMIVSNIIHPSYDMWSLGCLLYELFLGKPLFPSSCIGDYFSRIASYTLSSLDTSSISIYHPSSCDCSTNDDTTAIDDNINNSSNNTINDSSVTELDVSFDDISINSVSSTSTNTIRCDICGGNKKDDTKYHCLPHTTNQVPLWVSHSFYLQPNINICCCNLPVISSTNYIKTFKQISTSNNYIRIVYNPIINIIKHDIYIHKVLNTIARRITEDPNGPSVSSITTDVSDTIYNNDICEYKSLSYQNSEKILNTFIVSSDEQNSIKQIHEFLEWCKLNNNILHTDSTVSPESLLADFINLLLNMNPDQRPTPMEALMHPFLWSTNDTDQQDSIPFYYLHSISLFNDTTKQCSPINILRHETDPIGYS